MRKISRFRQLASTVCIATLLAGCGGGGGGADGVAPPVQVTPPGTTPPPTANNCALANRVEWVTARMRENYLFPELLANIPTAGVTDIDAYIDDLTAPARAQGKDKEGFSYLISIAEENRLINTGSNAGFGVLLRLDGNRLFVREAYETAPGFLAGMDRGTEILSIGTNASNLVPVTTLALTPTGVGDALGPNTPGLSRTFRIRTLGGSESTVTVTKTEFALDPISDRYGASIIDDGGKKVGYLHLRTFIVSNASSQLRTAFQTFKDQGVSEVIVDLRYNGGGLVSIGELLTNLLGGQRTSSDVLSKTVHNANNSGLNRTTFFAPQPQSIAPTKIAFIGTKASASASELVMNALIPFYGANVALIGDNTFGKPTGQLAVDRSECDDRLRVIGFKTVNRDNQGDYFSGLAPFFQRTCRASDDLTNPLGSRNEASISTALDFLAGRSCTPISTGVTTLSVGESRRLPEPTTKSAAQREVPGLF